MFLCCPQVTKAGMNERRELRQFQFTAWPDHGVPDHPAPFLLFLRRVRNLTPTDCGPMVVHCSAGVGRTGCFIVIDSMLERLRNDKFLDIYGHVTCLRAQRNYMVQVTRNISVLKQLIYILVNRHSNSIVNLY